MACGTTSSLVALCCCSLVALLRMHKRERVVHDIGFVIRASLISVLRDGDNGLNY